MKYLKRFHESASEEDLLKLMYHIDDTNKKFDEENEEGWSKNISYSHDPKLDYLIIEFGSVGYSEGFSDSWKVFYKESPIRVEMQGYGNTVYGDFQNNKIEFFNSIEELIAELTEQIN